MSQDLYVGKIVGTTFSPNKENLKAFETLIAESEGPSIHAVAKLEAESDNPHDKFAIAVLVGLWDPSEPIESVKFMKVGHIPKDSTAPIHQAGVRNARVEVKLKEFKGGLGGIDIRVTGP
jgi:hypothetical protein